VADPADSARQAGSLLALMLAFAPTPGLAQQADCPAPERWQRTSLDSTFERERWFAGVATPMRSSGRVQRDGDAILWRTLAPIEMVLRIDADGGIAAGRELDESCIEIGRTWVATPVAW